MAVVLLVEDEEQVRVLAQSYLEEQGHQVLSAGTPNGAMAILQRTDHVDLLFTDIDLRDVIASGIELAHDAVAHWPNLKVLYTTGRDLTDGMKARFVEHSAFLPALHSGGIAYDFVGAFQDKPAATAPAQRQFRTIAKLICRPVMPDA